MTEKKHTPGPWTVFYKQKYDEWHVSVPAFGMRLALFPDGIRTENHEADARLIAAAPDLLEALQEAIDCGMVPSSSCSDGGASKYSRQVQVADMIRAAVAKATGN